MNSDIIKLSLSEFVVQILRNDALKFEYVKKNNVPNINALLNKLIPNLLYYRKLRRQEIFHILKNDFFESDAEAIYECVNAVIDKVYFSDEELEHLEEIIWLRPSTKNISVFDEIENSELSITNLSLSSYIRYLLNEYARFPQYKRERILFEDELYIFAKACETGQIFHSNLYI